MLTDIDVHALFEEQAQWCERLGSPFTARLCKAFAARLDRTTAVGRRIGDWPGRADARGDAVPLRLAGALNALVRRGRLPELAALYPPNPLPDVDALGAAALRALVSAETEILGWLDAAPQTNEVARSGAVHAGLMTIATATGLPLALFEIGCSAGLNLFADRFRYRYGALDAGDPASPLLVAPAWSGGSPLPVSVDVVARRGCDLNPLSVTDPADRERLVAYVWPDQAQRLERLAQAIAIAEREPPRLDRADAADWVEAAFATPAEPGVCRVLFHTIAAQYFPEATQLRIAVAMTGAGEAATATTPVAWLRFEQDPAIGRAALTLTLWPNGGERRLAVGDAHVRALEWLV